MKYDAERRGFIVSPEEVADLKEKSEEARRLLEIIKLRERFGWAAALSPGRKELFS